MSRLLPLAILLLGCSTANRASGEIFDCKVDVPDCVQKYCCDDYCPKSMPCAKPARPGCCDKYCGKPLPCTREICCFGCDDYDVKCTPVVICPCLKLSCPRGSDCQSNPAP
jgi:hypothetical protein